MKSIILVCLCYLLICSCKTTAVYDDNEYTLSENPGTTTQKPPMFSNRLMVTLHDDVEPSYVEKKYQQYELKSKGLTSKSEKKYFFNFNNELITDVELVKKLNEDSKHIIKAITMQNVMNDIKSSKSSPRSRVKLPVK